MSALKVYWWKTKDGGDNLGDAVTSVLLSDLFGIEHRQAPFDAADLLGAGSTLGWIWSRPSADSRGPEPKLSVVGAGFMNPNIRVRKVSFLQIHSVRGYLSKALLDENDDPDISLGDPGLLSSLLYSRKSLPSFKFGIVPHIAAVERPDFINRFKDLPSHRIIDFRTNNLQRVMEEMESCELIVSQSLHGLIIADSLGLPTVWIDHGSLHPGGHFKFYDYFSSINRPFDLKISRGDTVNPQSLYRNSFEINSLKLRSIQNDIKEAFADSFEKRLTGQSEPKMKSTPVAAPLII